MPRWHKNREITPDICLRHTDVNAIIRKRSRSFSMELVAEREGGGRKGWKGGGVSPPGSRGSRGKQTSEKEERRLNGATLSFAASETPREVARRLASRIDNGVKTVHEGEEGGWEREISAPLCRSSQMCRC